MADAVVRYEQSTGGLGIASNGTTAVTIGLYGTGLKSPDGTTGPGGVLDKVRLYNADTVTQIVQIHEVPFGDAAGDDTLIERIPLAPKEVFRFQGGSRMPDAAFLQIKLEAAHTTNPVYAKADWSEFV